MADVQEFLKRISDGHSLLFCGAGFSADCLNFSEEEIGTADPLLKKFNSALDYKYNDLDIAAQDYLNKNGEIGLLQFLQDTFLVSRRNNTEIDEILSYPWSRVYTTNFDNVIGQSLSAIGVKHEIILCSDDAGREFSDNKTPVIHLHGAVEKWTHKNFSKSCVLWRESYLNAFSSDWMGVFRKDYAKAGAVFFIGFSNSDLHIAKEIHSVEAARHKVFFINDASAEGNRELVLKQEEYGKPLNIGRAGFVRILQEAGVQKQIKENRAFQCYEECTLPDLPAERAGTGVQENFVMYGQHKPEYLYRDITDNSNSYRIKRTFSKEIVDFLVDGPSVATITGGISSGKSVIFEECIFDLIMRGKKVFKLIQNYDSMEKECREIVQENRGCFLAIDNYFTIGDKIENIVNLCHLNGVGLLLSDRIIAYEHNTNVLDNIIKLGIKYNLYQLHRLDGDEVSRLAVYAGRISGWENPGLSDEAKERIIQNKYNSSLSNFLLGVFQSESIKEKFVTELNIYKTKNSQVERTLLMAFYLQHIGQPVSQYILSEMLRGDPLKNLDISDGFGNSFITYDSNKQLFILLPGVNAREALKLFFEDDLIIQQISMALQNIEHLRYDDTFKKVFSELCRYTQIKHVVDEQKANAFFDRLSEFPFCTSHGLFWLQWSMAMRESKKYLEAHDYLDNAYAIIDKGYGYVTSHLDDQKANLLLEEVQATDHPRKYFDNFSQAAKLLTQILQKEHYDKSGVTIHPYRTIRNKFPSFFTMASGNLLGYDESRIVPLLDRLNKLIEKIKKDRRVYIEPPTAHEMDRAQATINEQISAFKNK